MTVLHARHLSWTSGNAHVPRCHHPDLSGSKSAKVAAAVATRERQDHNVRLRAKPVQGQVERESRKRIWMYFDEQGTVKRPVTES